MTFWKVGFVIILLFLLFEFVHQLHINAVLEYWKLRAIIVQLDPYKPMRDYKFIYMVR